MQKIGNIYHPSNHNSSHGDPLPAVAARVLLWHYYDC